MGKSPLEGIRIIDFCWIWAGPSGTELLAYCGAEVIKVESETRLELARRTALRTGMPPPPTNQGHVHNSFALNKRGITLNLAQPRGIELAKRLIGISDVVTESFSGGVIDNLGLGYSVLKEIKPDIIMVSLSGFGHSGPLKEYRGYDMIFRALGGLVDLTGYPDSMPGQSGATGHMDQTNGTLLALATLAALEYRAKTGEGQYIDISQWETAICVNGDNFMDYFMNKRSPTRMGNHDNLWAPHNCYRCRGEDKWVSIAITNDEEWQALCQAMGKPKWIKDERFSDAYSRWQNQGELDRLITEWTVNYSHFEVTDILQKAGVAAFPSMSQDELAHDQHLIEREAFVEVEHPEMKKQFYLAPPWKLSATPAKVIKHAPLLGEDNEYVFCQLLGLSDMEFATLVGEQVIY